MFQSTNSMERKFIYFINPVSGTKDKGPILDLIRKETAARNIPFEIADTRADGNYAYLLDKIKTDQITDVIVCGGDGTVSQVASWLIHQPVNVGIIPMGSGNGLALAAGIKKDPKKALEVIFNGKASLVDGFRINNQFSCMLCGIGFDAQVAHDFAKQSTRGLATYVKQTMRNFFSSPHYPFVIEIEDLKINTEAFFISIANSNQFGNQVTIAPKASLSDGLLDIVIVNKMNRFKTLFSLLYQVSKGKVQEMSPDMVYNKGVTYLQTSSLRIINSGGAPLHIDGEPVASSDAFDIQVIPKAFNLLQA